VDDTGKSTRLILNQSELALPLVVSSFLIAQPSSFARFTYNVGLQGKGAFMLK
jgi:hypothetical protein